MDLTEIIDKYPYMASPAALALADMGDKFRFPLHIQGLNKELIDLAFGDTKRLICNIPYQCGKSLLSSIYFPAWQLLWNPDSRIVIVGNKEDFATNNFGTPIRDIIKRWGGTHGVNLKADTRAKGSWKIEGKDGGVTCKGPHGGVVGRPADCLVGETLIETDQGKMRLDTFSKLPDKPNVLSYNHTTGKSEWKKVVAVRRTKADELFEFTTKGGRCLRCTGRHRLFVLHGGYRDASLVGVGEDFATNNLSGVCREERKAHENLPAVLGKIEDRTGHGGLRLVREENPETQTRNFQGHSQKISSFLLVRLHDFKSLVKVQNLFSPHREKNKTLLRRLPTDKNKAGHIGRQISRQRLSLEETVGQTVRSLLPTVRAEIYQIQVLLKGVPERSPLGTDDWCREFPFQERGQLRKMVRGHAAIGDGARWSSLPLVWLRRDENIDATGAIKTVHEIQPAGTPRQRRRERQLPLKFGNAVRQVPQKASQQALSPDTVEVVRQLCVDGVDVYDIQVEGNGNFFANEILVHNCFIIDDLIRNAEEALSFTVMDAHWKWYQTTVQGRMRKDTRLAIINTRWSRRDLCGRIMVAAKQTKERWKVVKYKAIAGENDPLGRKPGEALWPEQVTLEQLHISRHKNPFWEAAWQQEPRDEEGGHFSPGLWPRYGSVERGWWLPVKGERRIARRDETFIIISVDWAASEKKRSDYTCIGVYGLTPYNNVLVLEIINDHFPLENAVPKLAEVCRKWRPGLVVVESTGFQTAMAIECRKYLEIPEPRQVSPHGHTKLQRAFPAITLGQGGGIYLPAEDERCAWVDAFEDQLIDFTGDDDEHDDQVDSLAYMALQRQYFVKPENYAPQGPIKLTEGFQLF